METIDAIERLAKTVDDATREAIEKLGTTADNVVVTVLDEGSRGGLFGIGSRPARVRVEIKPDPVRQVRDFVAKTCELMGLAVALDLTDKERSLHIEVKGESMGILIGKRGQTLDALQYVANLAFGRYGKLGKSIVIDSENYRRRRKETLESMARAMAKRARDTGQDIRLDPMPRPERQVVHTALQNDRHVRTYSEGDEPFRCVVIAAK